MPWSSTSQRRSPAVGCCSGKEGGYKKKKEASWHLQGRGADWLNKEGNKDGGLLCSQSVSLHHRLERMTKEGLLLFPFFFFFADPLTPHVSPPVVPAILHSSLLHSSASVRAVLQQQVTPAGGGVAFRQMVHQVAHRHLPAPATSSQTPASPPRAICLAILGISPAFSLQQTR